MQKRDGVVANLQSVPIGHRGGGERRCVLFVTDFYLEGILAGIVDYARMAGWEINANMRFHGVAPAVTQPCSGILATVAGATEAGGRLRDWLAARADRPIVRMIGTQFDLPYPAVDVDYAAAGREGARHLLELGHVHYAFYTLFEATDVHRARSGFEAQVTAAGRQAHRLDFSAAHRGQNLAEIPSQEVRCWLADGLKALPKPLAVMADDDRRAIDLLVACDLAGLRVPEDVAILGCDNHWVELGVARVPLSSVDMNFRGVGWRAAALLDRLMNGAKPAVEVTRVPPLGVVARRSTATFVTDSPGVTAAVVYLREHFREAVRVPVLARRAGMSERVFQTEFKRHVGRSARAELLRARLGCAARLLRDTDLKLEAIAKESGLGSASQLCRFFARLHGVSPNAWRAGTKIAVPGNP